MKTLLLAVLVLVVNCGCAARIGEVPAKRRSERLATERGRLSELTDPAAKTRSYITISDILLSFASDAIREGATGDVKSLLDQYVAAMEGARDTIVDASRDPQRRPGGFKDLEIAVRSHIRRLQDMSRQLTVDDRKPVEHAIAIATSVRDEMLRVLFPQQNPAAAA